MQTRLNDNFDDAWFLRDVDKHHPSCSIISDENIKETIFGTWLETGPNRQTTIPYYFSSTTPYWFSGIGSIYQAIRYKIYPRNIDSQLAPLMKNVIRYGLNKWTNITKGRIIFEEKINPRFYSKGIYFYTTSTDSLESLGALAETIPSLDNNGHLKQAFVFYPNSDTFWKTWIKDSSFSKGESAVRTLTHEMGHALGIDDFTHYPDILNSLKKTEDGVFCSVMDYTFETETFTSRCHEHCFPNYAVFPGSVDDRAINNLYYNRSSSIWGSVKLNQIASYGNNIFHSYMFSIGMTMSHQTIDSFFENIALYPNQPLLPQKVAHFLSDASVLAGIISMEFPVWRVVRSKFMLLNGDSNHEKTIDECIFKTFNHALLGNSDASIL